MGGYVCKTFVPGLEEKWEKTEKYAFVSLAIGQSVM